MPALLTTIEEKTKLLAPWRDLTIVARFDAGFAALPAERFVEEVLVGRLNVCCLTVGEGWRFGARGRGDGRSLQHLATGTWVLLLRLSLGACCGENW